jgi:hypothetical protein
MRVIVRKERPHPGAQLCLTRGQLSDLEMRNRRRARCDDRIRVAKDTGLHNLPLHGFGQNRSGGRSCKSPWNSPHGCRCSRCTAIPRGGGNPNDCGFDSSRSPHASHITPAEPGSDSPHMPMGRTTHAGSDPTQTDLNSRIHPTINKDQEPGGAAVCRHPRDVSRQAAAPTRRMTGLVPGELPHSRGESYGVAQEVLSLEAKTCCVRLRSCVARQLTEQGMK